MPVGGDIIVAHIEPVNVSLEEVAAKNRFAQPYDIKRVRTHALRFCRGSISKRQPHAHVRWQRSPSQSPLPTSETMGK